MHAILKFFSVVLLIRRHKIAATTVVITLNMREHMLFVDLKQNKPVSIL